MGTAAVTRPARLRSGDVVGVVAPAGVVDQGRLEAGVEVIRGFGLDVRLGAGVADRAGYLAGSDDVRCADLGAMLGDPGVKALLCARGGYGCQRIVPRLSLDAAAPTLVVGYSDITALLTALLRAGVSSVHGPMVADDLARGLTPAAEEHLQSLLFDPDYRWRCSVPTVVRPGVARGPLVGGCLSVVATTLGTPWQLETDGAILLLEDVNERAYRIDRLLLQFEQAGLFANVAGVVFGTFEGCGSFDGVTPLDVVQEYFRAAAYPVGYGIAAGHTNAATAVEHYAVPIGIDVELDMTLGELRACAGAVV